MTPKDESPSREASESAPDDAFIDAALRRALDHAPDLAAQPDWRLRKAILQAGRDAVTPAATPAAADVGHASWWQRLWGGDGRSRMPWNAAFATVLVATLVTVMWRSEPVPDARLDGEAQVAAPSPGEAAPVPAPPPAAEASPPAREEERKTEPTPAPKAEPAAPAPAPAPAPLREASPGIDQASNAAQERSVVRQPQKSRAEEASAPANATDALADVAPSAAEAQRGPALRRPLEVPPATSAVRPAPAPAPAATAPDSATRRAAPSTAPGAPAGGAVARDEATEPPTFAALAQWDRLVIAESGGARRTLSRDEATDLRALMGSVAISAVEARRFAGPVTWRLTMERNGQVLAVLEVGNQQVRWREGVAPAATGVPNAGALGALRAALAALVAAQPEAAPR